MADVLHWCRSVPDETGQGDANRAYFECGAELGGGTGNIPDVTCPRCIELIKHPRVVFDRPKFCEDCLLASWTDQEPMGVICNHPHAPALPTRLHGGERPDDCPLPPRWYIAALGF